MTRSFVFDAIGELDQVRNPETSQLSPNCRRPIEGRGPDYRGNISGACNCSEAVFFQPAGQGPAAVDRLSPLSQLSPHLAFLTHFTEDARCHFEERAAIKEYEAGLSRDEAERQALEEMLGL